MRLFAPLLISLLMLLASIAGCAAPGDVQVAQQVQARAYGNYLRNNDRILNTFKQVYQLERGSNISMTTRLATERILADYGKPRSEVDPAGKQSGALVSTLTTDQARDLVEGIIEQRDKAHAGTAAVLKRFDALIAANTKEWAKAQQLTAALGDYLAAGVDETLLGELSDSILQAVQEIKRGQGKGN